MQEENGKKALPILSDEAAIKNNCLKLYSYLIYNSSLVDKKTGKRKFYQKDVNLSEIGRAIRLDTRTIKKYWERLEYDGLISFIGLTDYEKTFSQNFSERRKQKNSFYTMKKPSRFRLIPKETIKNFQQEINISEIEMKIYIILANYQNACILNGRTSYQFGYADLIKILGLTNEKQNRIAVLKTLNWLEKLGLIKYETGLKKNGTFNQDIPFFLLKQVNFYINKEIIKMINEKGVELISDEDKGELLKSLQNLFQN